MKRPLLIVSLLVGLALGLSVAIGIAYHFLRKHDAESASLFDASSELDPIDSGTNSASAAGANKNTRAAKFEALDVDKDGVLSFTEFAATRKPREAERFFQLRDANKDGFLSREEFLPFSARPRPQ